MLLLDYPKWNQFSIEDYYFLQDLITMTPELEKNSEMLGDERFEAPIVERLNTRRGRLAFLCVCSSG